jgi:hypothetical protein
LYEGGFNEPIVLLVDALDEALTYTGNINIVQLLAKLTDLPSPVRFLVTARPDQRVLKHYSKVKPFDLIADAPPDSEDIRHYIASCLAAISTGLNEAEQERLAEEVADKAAGIFLYAAQILDNLLPRLMVMPNLDWSSLLLDPLHDMYYRYRDFLNRELGSDPQPWFDIYEPLLGLIAVAQGDGLTRNQLAAISGKDVERPLRACGQYLAGELPNGPFRVFHKSFEDFLLEDPDNIDYHINGTNYHSLIVDYYLGHLGA